MSEMVERVAAAIEAVELFSRFNDWTSDRVPGLPVEICRHGSAGEPEIVVVRRFPSGEERALAEVRAEMRAGAAIEAMLKPTYEMLNAGEAQDDTDGTYAHCEWHWEAMVKAALA